MSLVSEALKKAEREAAARAAREQGLPVPLDTPLQPYRARRSRRGGPHVAHLFLLLALLSGAAVVATFVFSRGTGGEEAPVRAVTSRTSAAPSAPATATTTGSESSPLRASERSAPKPATPSVPTAAPQPSAPAPSASESNPAPQSTLPLPKTTSQPPQSAPSASEFPSTRAALPPAAAAGRARDFLRRVDFPDGTKLELGGIVYSEAAPFAYLNGRLVGIGELVEGYRIDRIERERVHLSGDAGEITLRLKGP